MRITKLKFAQNFASAHNSAHRAYRHELRVQLGDENYHTLDQMATNARMDLHEFTKSRAQKLLADCQLLRPKKVAGKRGKAK